MKVKETDDPIYGKCVLITNNRIQAAVTVDVGPRIIDFGFCGDENLLYQDVEQKYKIPLSDTGNGKAGFFHPYGGHRLWITPERSAAALSPDDSPVVYSILADGVSFTPPKRKTADIQLGFEIMMGEGASDIMIVHTAENCSKSVKACGLWPITMLKGGGLAIVPQSEDRSEPRRPNRAVIFWPGTDIRDRRITYGNRFIAIRHIKGESIPLKIGCNDVPGWVGYVGKKNTLVKRFVFNSQAAYPDFGCSCEVRLEPDFAEIDSFSPLYRMEPGEKIKYVENISIYHTEHAEIMDSEDGIDAYFNSLA